MLTLASVLISALSPTPPFSGHSGRASIFLSILLPIIGSSRLAELRVATVIDTQDVFRPVSSAIFSDRVFSQVFSAFIGFLFFGGPVLARLADYLSSNYPGWQERMELRK